jgi:hypothetical protein
MHMDHDALLFQYQWGFGHDTAFPIHDARWVSELTGWAIGTLTLLLDHMEHRQHVVTASKARAVDTKPSLNLRVALERYLEDLFIQDWDRLPWAIEIEYLDRQVECGTLVCDNILARERNPLAWVCEVSSSLTRLPKGYRVLLPLHEEISAYTYQSSVVLTPVVTELKATS